MSFINMPSTYWVGLTHWKFSETFAKWTYQWPLVFKGPDKHRCIMIWENCSWRLVMQLESLALYQAVAFLVYLFFFFFYKGANYFYYLLLTYFNYYYVTSDEMSPTWWNFSHLLPLSPGCGMHSLLHPAFLWHFRYSTSTEFIGFYCGYLFIRICLRLICFSFEVFTLFIFF